MTSVIVLHNGYCNFQDDNSYTVECTCTLIKSEDQFILIDPLGPSSAHTLIQRLKDENLTAEQISIVVCTHGHSDHVGNLCLFPQSKHIVGYDINIGQKYFINPLRNGHTYPLTKDVIPTPGHTSEDISIMVSNGQIDGKTFDKVAIVGDLFEREHDENIWIEMSCDPETQKQNRSKIMKEADIIIPGHGKLFYNRYKQK